MGKKGKVRLDEELEQNQTKELAEATEEASAETETTPDMEEVEELDWKAAARHLKGAVEDQSIDRYFKKAEIAQLRSRYNNKERTQTLYDAIMRL